MNKKIEKGTICWDCKKELKKGDEFVEYKTQSGLFYKCKNCYEKDSKLRNFQKNEVYSRIVGYLRPVEQWNKGKTEEFKNRVEFKA